MAYEFYVTIEGTKQGKFKGESSREAHKDKMAGLEFEYSVNAPRDAASGAPSGKRQHNAVKFVKEWGAATPQLFQAIATNETLKSVVFEFYQTTAEGQEDIYHTIKLANATVSKLEQFVRSDVKTVGQHATRELEAIYLTFQRIELDNKLGKTAAADDWTK